MSQSAAAGERPSGRPDFDRPRVSWPVLVGVVLFLIGSNLLWYHYRFHLGRTYLQPLFMLAGTLFFLGLLRVFRGYRWSQMSKEGRFVIVSALVLFSLMWLFGRVGFFERNLRQYLPETRLSPLYGFFYFSMNAVIARTLIPIVFMKTVLKRRPVEFGYRVRGGFELWWVYLGLFLIVLPAVLLIVEHQTWGPQFLAKYPMCRAMIRPEGIAWEHFLLYQLAYGLIFLSGESFWRGYIICGLDRDLGYTALGFMVIPYTMAHYGKPLPETMGAILTGFVLGYLALRHRSWVLGFLTHWAVALAMDITAIVHRGVALF